MNKSEINEERELEHLDNQPFDQRLADTLQQEDAIDVEWISEWL